MKEKRWTTNTVVISERGARIDLRYTLWNDKVSILIEGQDYGIDTTMPRLKEQLAKWFKLIEETVE